MSAEGPHRYQPRLHPRFVSMDRNGRWFLGVLVLGALAIALYGFWGSVALIRAKPAEDDLWQRGTPAHVPDDYEVKARSRLIFQSYEAEFTYLDAERHARHGSLAIWTMFYDPIPFNRPPVVRYDPQHPEAFVTSWQVEAGWNRLGPPLILLLVGAAGAFGIGWELRRAGRWLAALERACPFRDWEVVTLPAWVEQGAHGTRVHRYRGPSFETGAVEDQAYGSGGTPLFVDQAQTRMAGLRCVQDPKLVVPLASDLRPFLLPATKAELLRSELAQLG